MRRMIIGLLACTAMVGSACSSSSTDDPSGAPASDEVAANADGGLDAATDDVAEEDATDETDGDDTAAGGSSSFTAQVWADNWFALYVNGELVGEDSVSITTERSFNAETISFEATYPLTIAIEAKDFKETDSGIEYIGLNNQQMGDGGLIAQIIDDSTGQIVAVTSSDWSALVVHRAPLNTECERDADPDATCEFEITETPTDWATAAFDDSGWDAATVWTANDVGPKDGYDEIEWDSAAALIWGADLEVDNTILLCLMVSG